MSLDDINVEISDSLLASTLELYHQLSWVLSHLGLAHTADFGLSQPPQSGGSIHYTH